MKPLVVYHNNCADGFGAAFAAWKVLGDKAEYQPMNYSDIDTHLEYTGRDVYVLDFSFPKEVMEHMFANASRVVWLDHHATVFKDWGYEPDILVGGDLDIPAPHIVILDNNRSGAMLAWEYFHPGTEVPMLIQHIDDRDRWVWQLESTRAFSEALNSYPYTFDTWDVLLDETGYTACNGLEGYDRFVSEGEAILRATQQRVDGKANGELKTVCLGSKEAVHEGLALNATNDISEIGNAVAKKSGTFSLSFFIKGDDAICSLRSIAPYDVSVIAKYYGGGGHAQAAGFKMPISRFFTEIWK